MISTIVLSCIIVQITVALYLFNCLQLKDDFEKKLNAILIVLVFHLGTKFFILTVLKNTFLYHNNATGFGLAYGPLLYIMARSYVKQALPFRSILLHLLPFSLCTLAYFIIGAGYVLKIIPGHFVTIYAPGYQCLATLSLCIYPIVTYNILHKYASNKNPLQQYKERLLTQMAYVLLAGVLLGTIVACIHLAHHGTVDFDLRLIPYICLAAWPVLIVRYKMVSATAPAPVFVPIAVLPQENQKQPEKQYRKSALDKQMMDQYEMLLRKFMGKSKIYLETEISLEGLSASVNIPKHHLTQLLNERFKKNFYVFINEYRINEAIEKLKDPGTGDSILSLAYDCGFNSKSSFNNYFKKVTGYTPSMYRKEHLVKDTVKDL